MHIEAWGLWGRAFWALWGFLGGVPEGLPGVLAGPPLTPPN